MKQNPFALAQFLNSCASLQQLPQDTLPEVAFAGRSNSGKSSALNAICGQNQLARVSKTPGRTQMINLFQLPTARLADLPGYGFAQVPRAVQKSWGDLVSAYLQGRENLRGVVIIMDIRHPLRDFDRQMLDFAASRDLPVHVLLTKADKLGFGAAKNQLLAVQAGLREAGDAATVQLFSSETKQGLEDARDQIATLLGIPLVPQ